MQRRPPSGHHPWLDTSRVPPAVWSVETPVGFADSEALSELCRVDGRYSVPLADTRHPRRNANLAKQLSDDETTVLGATREGTTFYLYHLVHVLTGADTCL